MKVVTWNLGYWQHQKNHTEAWKYLREEIKPDVALLQEINPPALPKGEYLLFKKIRMNWGTALYTRNMPFEEIHVKKYSERVVAAKLELSKGRIIIAVSIHAPIINGRVFPHLDNIFDEVKTIVSDQTFIVGGDLNTARLAEKTWPGHGHGPFFKRLEESIFFDCFRKFHDAEQQTFFRNGMRYPFQDGHLFVSRDLFCGLQACDVIDNTTTHRVSDHIPALAEIVI
jgi:exonuclease III